MRLFELGLVDKMGFQVLIFLLLVVCLGPEICASSSEKSRLVVDTSTTVAKTDDNYICATIDWWPHEKCNYNNCPWGSASAINLDLSHPFLSNAIQAFKNLRIRIGGSLEDQVMYPVGNPLPYCPEFQKQSSGMFGFSKGCLHMERWDELNNFFTKTGAILTFSLNALNGRHRTQSGVWQGNWDSTNARDFINYTISKGYKVDSWEFGNELCGTGVGARVWAEQYGKDMITLNNMIDELYTNAQPRPRLLAPGGFYDKSWFEKMLHVSGPNVVDGVTHHLYSLGPGSDRNIKNKILNPNYLSNVQSTFINVASTVQSSGPWAAAWVGESGGAYNSGAEGISDTFLNSFWYLDQLGMAARYKTEVYCRQSLVGGFYGLLDRTTFVPNPDYYGALLWHRLMGKGVLSVSSNASPYLRAYSHCAKGRSGVTLLLINLSTKTTYKVDVGYSSSAQMLLIDQKGVGKGASFSHVLKRSILWIGDKALDEDLHREEYHLTPDDGNLQSRTVLLNGKPLEMTPTGVIPSFEPVLKDIKSRISIAPLSIKFIVNPQVDAPGCR